MYKSPKELWNIKSWIDAEKCDGLKVIEYNSDNSKNQNEENYTENVYKIEVYENNTNFFANAKQKELKSWEDKNVYNLHKNENQKYITTLGIDIKRKPRRLYSKSKVSCMWLRGRLSSKYRQRIAYLLKREFTDPFYCSCSKWLVSKIDWH